MDEKLMTFITEMVVKEIEKLRETEHVPQGTCSHCSYTNGIKVGISARHLHLTQEHVEILFGKGHTLTFKKELMGGQFAAEECVTIVGAQLNAIEKVRVLGPVRKRTQVEISKTDAIKLGINPPIRESGQVEGSASIHLIGPKGTVSLTEGCIIAKRHIHMSTKDAARFQVSDGQDVAVQVAGERGGVLQHVTVRVDDSYSLEMHIDTDEANAFGIKCGELVELI